VCGLSREDSAASENSNKRVFEWQLSVIEASVCPMIERWSEIGFKLNAARLGGRRRSSIVYAANEVACLSAQVDPDECGPNRRLRLTSKKLVDGEIRQRLR
jgi:hypothetical protein